MTEIINIELTNKNDQKLRFGDSIHPNVAIKKHTNMYKSMKPKICLNFLIINPSPLNKRHTRTLRHGSPQYLGLLYTPLHNLQNSP